MSATDRAPSARVGSLRAVSLVLAVTAAAGLVFGTAGFTAIGADGGVEIGVTADDDAYLGYEPLVNGSAAVTANRSTAVVEYRNQFDVDLDDLTVDVARANPGSGPTVESFDAPHRLDRGATGSVSVTLHCSNERTVTLEFAVTGSGPGVRVSLDRTLTLTCVPE